MGGLAGGCRPGEHSAGKAIGLGLGLGLLLRIGKCSEW
jgi:hypothetical protein